MNVNVYVLIVKYASNVLFPVTRSLLVAPVYPSLHQLNVYPVFAIAVTAVPVVLYTTFWIAVPEIVPPVVATYVNVYVLIVK